MLNLRRQKRWFKTLIQNTDSKRRLQEFRLCSLFGHFCSLQLCDLGGLTKAGRRALYWTYLTRSAPPTIQAASRPYASTVHRRAVFGRSRKCVWWRHSKRRLGESCVYASRFTRLELKADSKRTNLCVLNQCFESAFRGILRKWA